jgi:hypothetical protein
MKGPVTLAMFITFLLGSVPLFDLFECALNYREKHVKSAFEARQPGFHADPDDDNRQNL